MMFFLVICLLTPFTPTRVALSIVNEETGYDGGIEEECGCPFLCTPVQAPELTPGSGTPPGSPFALFPTSPSYILVPNNNGIQQPPHGFQLSASTDVPCKKCTLNNKNTKGPFNIDKSEVGGGLPIVNTEKTKIFNEGVDSCGDKSATGWYPTDDAFIYSPGYDYEKYPERRKYITVPFTTPGSYPNNRGVGSATYADKRDPLCDQVKYVSRCGLGHSEQSNSQYTPKITQNYYEPYIFFPNHNLSKLSIPTIGQHPRVQQSFPAGDYGYPQLYPKQEVSELSSTTVAQNGYTSYGDYNAFNKLGYLKNNNCCTLHNYRFGQSHPKQDVSELPSNTVVPNVCTAGEEYNYPIKEGYQYEKSNHENFAKHQLKCACAPIAQTNKQTIKDESFIPQQNSVHPDNTIYNFPAQWQQSHALLTQPDNGNSKLNTEQILTKSLLTNSKQVKPNEDDACSTHVCECDTLYPKLPYGYGFEYDANQDQEFSKFTTPANIPSYQMASGYGLSTPIQGGEPQLPTPDGVLKVTPPSNIPSYQMASGYGLNTPIQGVDPQLPIPDGVLKNTPATANIPSYQMASGYGLHIPIQGGDQQLPIPDGVLKVTPPAANIPSYQMASGYGLSIPIQGGDPQLPIPDGVSKVTPTAANIPSYQMASGYGLHIPIQGGDPQLPIPDGVLKVTPPAAHIPSYQMASGYGLNAPIQGGDPQVPTTDGVSTKEQTAIIKDEPSLKNVYGQTYQQPDLSKIYPFVEGNAYNTYGTSTDYDYTSKLFTPQQYYGQVLSTIGNVIKYGLPAELGYGNKEGYTEQSISDDAQTSKPTDWIQYGVGNNIPVYPGSSNNIVVPSTLCEEKENVFVYGRDNLHTPIIEQGAVAPAGPGVLHDQNPGQFLQINQVPGIGKPSLANDIYTNAPGRAYQLALEEQPATLYYDAGVPPTGSDCTIPSLQEPLEHLVELFDGCTVSQSQLEDIVNSFEVPEKCVLIVPHIFSGPLDRFAHIIDCFPASIDVNDGYVLLPSDLVVPYTCYKHIASVFAGDLPLFRDTGGVVLADGRFVDLPTVASIVASTKTPDRRLIIAGNDIVIPFEIFKSYINNITPEDKQHIKVLLPEIKEPVDYNTFIEIFDKYVTKYPTIDKQKIVKLLGSKTELSLEQFMAVMDNCRAIKTAVITLPSKKIMPLLSFIPLASILGDNYTTFCLVNIPNTPHVLPFTVVREIFKTYLENKKNDLSQDTDVNWNFEENSLLYDSSDIEIFSSLDEQPSKRMPTQYSKGKLDSKTDSQNTQYLVCHQETLPTYNLLKPDGVAKHEPAKMNSIYPGNRDRMFKDILLLQKCAEKCLPPARKEPVYACERFDKVNPQTSY